MDLDKLNLIKLAYGGKMFGSSRFLLLTRLPVKMTLALKLVKSGSKIIILLC
jgi:hypothetical protein